MRDLVIYLLLLIYFTTNTFVAGVNFASFKQDLATLNGRDRRISIALHWLIMFFGFFMALYYFVFEVIIPMCKYIYNRINQKREK